MPSTSCSFALPGAHEVAPCPLPIHHVGPHVLESLDSPVELDGQRPATQPALRGFDELLARLAQGVISDVMGPPPPRPLLRSGVVVHDSEGAVVAVAVSEAWAARLVGEGAP